MTIEELNAIPKGEEFAEFIRVCEARQVKALSRIADDVTGSGEKRLVLIAGPSSAGKTTTAKRLCTQLRVNGVEAMHLSTDDYFVGDRRNPRDENGELDYECVQCVDMPRLAEDMNRLLAGEAVKLRSFDFVAHEGFDQEKATTLSASGVIVLEGIHALNPLLTSGIPDEVKYRVYVEPRTQLEVFGMTKLKSSNGRLLRRLVRDNQFRKMPPGETLRMWPKVLAGEEKWIKPFRGNAQAEFDSGLLYELAVLKPYVSGLLTRHLMTTPDDVRARSLLELLTAVESAGSAKVPGDSILRETIGGSLLEY